MPHPTSFFLRPAPGIRVADPETGQYLPAAGALMPRSAFWLRRVADGDVVEVQKPAPAKKAQAVSEAKEA